MKPSPVPTQRYTLYIIRVGEHPGFRDVRFTDKAEADRFALLAQDDGTYWGREERVVDPAMTGDAMPEIDHPPGCDCDLHSDRVREESAEDRTPRRNS